MRFVQAAILARRLNGRSGLNRLAKSLHRHAGCRRDVIIRGRIFGAGLIV